MSTAEPGNLLRRTDLAIAAAVAIAALAVYSATSAHSLAGLSAPDIPPPRILDDSGIVEYLQRTGSAFGWWPLPAIAASACTVLVYVSARGLAATRTTAAAAALALAFSRGFWQQALLPGIQMWLALLAGIAIVSALEWERTRRTLWMATAIASLAGSMGLPVLRANVPVPAIGRWLFLELNAASIALAVLGAAVLFRRRREQAAIAVGAAVFLIVTTPLRGASSLHAALIPALVALWPLVAVGASLLLAWLGGSRQATWLAVALIPLVPLVGNYRHVVSDTDAAVRWHLDRLAERLDGCHSVVGQPNMAAPPDPSRIPALALSAFARPASARSRPRSTSEAGRLKDQPDCDVFALPHARTGLEHLGYRFERVRLPGQRLAEYLRAQSGGSILALAVPSHLRASLAREAARHRLPLGGTPLLGQSLQEAYALVGTAGGRGAVESSGANADVTFRTTEGARPDAADIRARVDGQIASISIGASEAVRAAGGAAVAVVAPDGELLARVELRGDELRVEFDRQFGVSRLTGRLPCTTLSPARFTDVTSHTNQGRIGVRMGRTNAEGVVLYAARDRPLAPWRVLSWSVLAPHIAHRSFRSIDRGVEPALGQALEADGLTAAALGGWSAVHRIQISGGATASASSLTSLDFAGLPARVLARAAADDPIAAVCPAPRGEGLFSNPDVRQESLRPTPSSFGDGWIGPGRASSREWRLSGTEGELLIALAQPVTMTITVTLTPPSDTGAAVALRVNGTTLPAQPLRTNTGTYEWAVAAAVARAGVNQIFVIGQPGTMLTDMRFVRIDRP